MRSAKLSFLFAAPENPSKHPLNLRLQAFQRTFVADDEISPSPFFLQRGLQGLPRLKFLTGPVSVPLYARDSPFLIGLDEYHSITLRVEVAFEQKRGIEDDGPDRRIVYCYVDHICPFSGDQGMHQTFQFPATNRVPQHAPGQRPTVGPPVRADNLLSEAQAQLRLDVRPVQQHLI